MQQTQWHAIRGDRQHRMHVQPLVPSVTQRSNPRQRGMAVEIEGRRVLDGKHGLLGRAADKRRRSMGSQHRIRLDLRVVPKPIHGLGRCPIPTRDRNRRLRSIGQRTQHQGCPSLPARITKRGGVHFANRPTRWIHAAGPSHARGRRGLMSYKLRTIRTCQGHFSATNGRI